MKNKDTTALLVFNATSDFPDYFIHPVQKILQSKGIDIQYIDADSHSDDFYIDFIIQSLQSKEQLFLYIQVHETQKKLPQNCLKILSQLQKMKEKVHVLCPISNVMLNAYTKNFSVFTEQDLEKQAEYIISNIFP